MSRIQFTENIMKNLKKYCLPLFFLPWAFLVSQVSAQTAVSIKGNEFHINGKPTYEGRYWKGYKIEGLLINSRMVQGVFDDMNPETAQAYAYQDTKKWDAQRNNNEFVAAMSEWKSYGMNCFSLNMQGGSPNGYNSKPCLNSGFNPDGSLIKGYMQRLDNILKRADELEMVVILGFFYFRQDENMKNEQAIINATTNMIDWLHGKAYRNVLVEISNETHAGGLYDHDILLPHRIHELIKLAKSNKKNGYTYPVGTSFGGCKVPTENVVKASDYILIHGNGAKTTNHIQELVDNTKKVKGYRNKPIINNEDDHYNFDQEVNNFSTSLKNYVSWGYLDFRFPGETDYIEGYQSVPVDWGINSDRKKAFFNYVKEITGVK